MSQLNLYPLPLATAGCKVHSWEGEERTGPEGRHQLYSNWEVAVLGSEHGPVEEASTLGDYVPWSHGPLTSPGGAQLMARTGALALGLFWGRGQLPLKQCGWESGKGTVQARNLRSGWLPPGSRLSQQYYDLRKSTHIYTLTPLSWSLSKTGHCVNLPCKLPPIFIHVVSSRKEIIFHVWKLGSKKQEKTTLWVCTLMSPRDTYKEEATDFRGALDQRCWVNRGHKLLPLTLFLPSAGMGRMCPPMVSQGTATSKRRQAATQYLPLPRPQTLFVWLAVKDRPPSLWKVEETSLPTLSISQDHLPHLGSPLPSFLCSFPLILTPSFPQPRHKSSTRT